MGKKKIYERVVNIYGMMREIREEIIEKLRGRIIEFDDRECPCSVFELEDGALKKFRIMRVEVGLDKAENESLVFHCKEDRDDRDEEYDFYEGQTNIYSLLELFQDLSLKIEYNILDFSFLRTSF